MANTACFMLSNFSKVQSALLLYDKEIQAQSIGIAGKNRLSGIKLRDCVIVSVAPVMIVTKEKSRPIDILRTRFVTGYSSSLLCQRSLYVIHMNCLVTMDGCIVLFNRDNALAWVAACERPFIIFQCPHNFECLFTSLFKGLL